MNLIIFPNQLFADHPGLKRKPDQVFLVEDSLFFGDHYYPLKFHKQKLWLHRASMKRYEQLLKDRDFTTRYIEHDGTENSMEKVLREISKGKRATHIAVAQPVDFMLEKRLQREARRMELKVEYLRTPGFLNDTAENLEYRAGKKRWFMADFYKWQRQRLNVLMDNGNPLGGKWSFDTENRKKVPKKLLDQIPPLTLTNHDAIDEDARHHVESRYAHHPGSIANLFYPTSHKLAEKWLNHFLTQRFDHFGDYEDAIVEGESWLWHSVLTPMLNIGLLTPGQIVRTTLKHAERHEVPINSLEGFLRQIMGWREFIRATYEDLGVQMRTTNHWRHHRPMPSCFYDGTTGIPPIDDTIRRILDTGYCHHIERLMVLGGFMFLCELDPQDIYNWFMEMFVDSYDWVMVPNAYAMSQNADGGLITTKPYFSGSSYIRKMSHYPRGAWCETWDGLYWRWIWNHADELARNPRWAMMCSMVRKMDSQKRKLHLQNAESFLEQLKS